MMAVLSISADAADCRQRAAHSFLRSVAHHKSCSVRSVEIQFRPLGWDIRPSNLNLGVPLLRNVKDRWAAGRRTRYTTFWDGAALPYGKRHPSSITPHRSYLSRHCQFSPSAFGSFIDPCCKSLLQHPFEMRGSTRGLLSSPTRIDRHYLGSRL